MQTKRKGDVIQRHGTIHSRKFRMCGGKLQSRLTRKVALPPRENMNTSNQVHVDLLFRIISHLSDSIAHTQKLLC